MFSSLYIGTITETLIVGDFGFGSGLPFVSKDDRRGISSDVTREGFHSIHEDISDVWVIVPWHLMAILGTLVAACNLTAGLGVENLFFSGLWLVGYIGLLFFNIKADGGLRTTLTHFCEHFSPQRIFRVLSDEANSRLWMGYRLFGREITLLEVENTGIREISWSPGQASCVTNTDMSDWLLWLKVRTPSVLVCGRRRFEVDGYENFRLAGGLTKDDAEKCALGLQGFLKCHSLECVVIAPSKDIIERISKKRSQ